MYHLRALLYYRKMGIRIGARQSYNWGGSQIIESRLYKRSILPQMAGERGDG